MFVPQWPWPLSKRTFMPYSKKFPHFILVSSPEWDWHEVTVTDPWPQTTCQAVPEMLCYPDWNIQQVQMDEQPEDLMHLAMAMSDVAASQKTLYCIDVGQMCFFKDGGSAQVKWSISPGDQYTPAWVNGRDTHRAPLPSREEMFSP